MAGAWRQLGAAVAPLSNAGGLPLARTVKLIVDPLVVRPAQRPHLGHALLAPDAARELADRIRDAGDDLAATAAWYTLLKRRRRARGITDGSPQDLYFSRAYELARTRGAPGADDGLDAALDAVLDEVHEGGYATAADLREFLATPDVASAVRRAIDEAWAESGSADAAADGASGALAGALAALDALAEGRDAEAFDAFDALVDAGAGSAAGRALGAPGAARRAGLSDREVPAPPAVGETASKSALPAPFDRSILERLFQAVSALDIAGTAALAQLADEEARRTGLPWQLGSEAGRVVAAAGLAATDGEGSAAARLDARWQREAFVRHARRTPGEADPRAGAREAILRRLWARLHGRELRRQPVDAAEAWDLVDGATRSVILDRRDLAKTRLGRAA